MECDRTICYMQDYNGGCETCPCNEQTLTIKMAMNGLEHCLISDCTGCPYDKTKDSGDYNCFNALLDDVHTLLSECLVKIDDLENKNFHNNY